MIRNLVNTGLILIALSSNQCSSNPNRDNERVTFKKNLVQLLGPNLIDDRINPKFFIRRYISSEGQNGTYFCNVYSIDGILVKEYYPFIRQFKTDEGLGYELPPYPSWYSFEFRQFEDVKMDGINNNEIEKNLNIPSNRPLPINSMSI